MQLFIDFLHQEWLLWTALGVVFVIYTVTELYSKSRGPKSLTAGQLTALMNAEGTGVVDIRATTKFVDGHILGATSLPEADITAAKLQKLSSTAVVLVCDNGVKSLQLARKLQAQGMATICVLEGGMQAWRGAGMPAVKGKA